MKNKKVIPNKFHLHIQTKYRMLISPTKKEKENKNWNKTKHKCLNEY